MTTLNDFLQACIKNRVRYDAEITVYGDDLDAGGGTIYVGDFQFDIEL